MKILGVILIVLGIIGFAYGGITWTTRDKVIDLGSVEVTRAERQRIPVPPIAGAICTFAGVALILVDRRRVPS